MDSNKKPLEVKDLVNLTLGTQTPQTDKEKELLKQIEEIKHKGRSVEIPSDFL
jgi:hypothetical protein